MYRPCPSRKLTMFKSRSFLLKAKLPHEIFLDETFLSSPVVKTAKVFVTNTIELTVPMCETVKIPMRFSTGAPFFLCVNHVPEGANLYVLKNVNRQIWQQPHRKNFMWTIAYTSIASDIEVLGCSFPISKDPCRWMMPDEI